MNTDIKPKKNETIIITLPKHRINTQSLENDEFEDKVVRDYVIAEIEDYFGGELIIDGAQCFLESTPFIINGPAIVINDNKNNECKYIDLDTEESEWWAAEEYCYAKAIAKLVEDTEIRTICEIVVAEGNTMLKQQHLKMLCDYITSNVNINTNKALMDIVNKYVECDYNPVMHVVTGKIQQENDTDAMYSLSIRIGKSTLTDYKANGYAETTNDYFEGGCAASLFEEVVESTNVELNNLLSILSEL